jgi:hypothetical protein
MGETVITFPSIRRVRRKNQSTDILFRNSHFSRRNLASEIHHAPRAISPPARSKKSRSHATRRIATGSNLKKEPIACIQKR